jgi:DNA-binding CsgD family transcriptional regulator
MQLLLNWQAHFEIAVRRIAASKENDLDDNSLAGFIRDFPTATLMLDWDLHLRHHNAAATELCRLWLNPNSRGRVKLSGQKPMLPREISSAMEALKPKIEKNKPSRPGPLKSIELKTVRHPKIKDLSARIYFTPSKSLALSRGRFLVQLQHETSAHNASPSLSKLAQLSRRERETALQAARGLTNPEIGKALHKSPGTVKVQLSHIFRKLKIKSRVQLAALLAR